MPRFFFHSEDGFLVHDHEGAELPDIGAARIEAVRLASGLLGDHPQALWESDHWRLLVTDAAGMILFTIEVNTVIGAAVLPWPKHEAA